MPRYRVDPRHTHTVEMKDGTQYPVPRSGYVSVAARHEDEMGRSKALSGNVDGVLTPTQLVFPSGGGKPCPSGDFTGWPWQRTCPRCGATLS